MLERGRIGKGGMPVDAPTATESAAEKADTEQTVAEKPEYPPPKDE